MSMQTITTTDAHLAQAIQQYGALTYLILFVIIFCETGLVVTPFKMPQLAASRISRRLAVSR